MGYLVKDVGGKYVVRYNYGYDTDEVIGEVQSGTTTITYDGVNYYYWNTNNGKTYDDGKWVESGEHTGIRELSDFLGDKGVHVIWSSVEDNTNQTTVDDAQTIGTPIKSDGGSSDYYKRTIPKLMLERWNRDGYIEAKDVMKLFLGNDYNFSNSFKAHCRVQSLRDGVGKDGASEKYDLKKAWFFGEDAYNDYLERKE